MKKRIVLFIMVAAMLLSMPACGEELPQVTPAGENGTSFAGIGVAVTDIEYQENEIVLEIQWRNETQYSAMYGEMFGLQRLNNGQWVNCEMNEDCGFITIGYMLKPGETVTKFYKLQWIFGELEPGAYRFVTSCAVSVEDRSETCKLWAEFYLGEEKPDISYSKAEFTSPPAMRLLHSDGMADTQLGTYTWSYAQGDGTWTTVCADSAHPLQCEDLLEVISPGNSLVSVEFEDWPDSFIIRCWPDSEFGNPDAESGAVMFWNDYFQLRGGGYIYGVTAKWDDNGSSYYGEATYFFYAAPAALLNIMPASTNIFE